MTAMAGSSMLACRSELLTRRNVAAERPAVCRRGSSARRAPTTAGAVTAADAVDPVKKRKVMVFVEPSPFSHVSGMRNRFLGLIESLDQEGDDVVTVTPCVKRTTEYKGTRVISVLGLQLPFYNSKTLLMGTALSARVLWELVTNRPDIIHASYPGTMVFAVILFAKLLRIPLVVSYHTHIPEYIPRYNLWSGLVAPLWALIRVASRMSHLCLVTSSVMEAQLAEKGCKQLDVWKRGVDTVMFNPRFRSAAMRQRMSNGNEGPLLVHVGRLGAEKNIKAIREMMATIPNCCLAIVGDGPQRAELEEYFEGTRTVFMGMMNGQDLSEAYASGDVFVMPSESETLGFVVLEAMASKMPVLSVAAGGLTDIITEDGKMGLLYQPGDYDAANKQLAKLIDDPAFRERIAQGGFDEVSRWNTHASNVWLREQQYTGAMRRFRLQERFKSLLMWCSIHSWVRALLRVFGLSPARAIARAAAM